MFKIIFDYINKALKILKLQLSMKYLSVLNDWKNKYLETIIVKITSA